MKLKINYFVFSLTVIFNGTVKPHAKGFQGTNNFFCYRATSVIANKENKRNKIDGSCYRRNSFGSSTVRARFNCNRIVFELIERF